MLSLSSMTRRNCAHWTARVFACPFCRDNNRVRASKNTEILALTLLPHASALATDKGGFASRGFIFEPPDFNNTQIGEFNEFQEKLSILLASLSDNQRLQVKWFCDSAFLTLPPPTQHVSLATMSTITTILEPDPDGPLHLPLPKELRYGKIRITATMRRATEESHRARAGVWSGRQGFWMAPNFDDPLDDFRESVE